MDSNGSEACGRCAMTSVVSVAEDENGDENNDDRDTDPFSGARIELDDNDLRIASAPAIAAGRVKRRLDELATRLVHGQHR